MKKKIIALLTIVLAIISFTACSKDLEKNVETSALSKNIDKYWQEHNMDALYDDLMDVEYLESIRADMLKMYGENKEILSNYDSDLAAKTVTGTFVGKKIEEDIVAWKGIPYAKSPVGNLRWRAPQKLDASDKVFEAYYFGKTAIQLEGGDEFASLYPQGEDCLNLNVWNNFSDDSTNKPIMVWIHGGAYVQGGTSEPLYDGANFVKNNPDVIFISIAYRTDFLGFINLSKVDGAEDYVDTANLGILDQIAALSWIKENAKAFGGDSERITIFGESAGAGCVSALTLAPQAKGLFQRGILQSGTASSYLRTAEKSIEHTDLIMELSGAKNLEDLLSLSEEDIRKLETIISLEFGLDYTYPQLDGIVLPKDIKAAIESNTRNGIDIMVGTTKDEYNYWTMLYGKELNMQMTQQLIDNSLKDMNDEQLAKYEKFMSLQEGDDYNKLLQYINFRSFHAPARYEADAHAANNQNTYVYLFTEESNDEDLLSYHSFDLGFVLGNVNEKDVKDIPEAYKLSEIMQRMWVNFAKYGDPSICEGEVDEINNINWDKYEIDNPLVMILNSKECRMECDPIKENCDLIKELFLLRIKR